MAAMAVRAGRVGGESPRHVGLPILDSADVRGARRLLRAADNACMAAPVARSVLVNLRVCIAGTHGVILSIGVGYK